MAISFAAAASHAPGITAWTEAAPVEQKNAIFAAYDRLHQAFEKSNTDVLVMLTSEHWVHFFLDHISPMCIGRGDYFHGPVEPWLRVEKRQIKGDPAFAKEIIERCYDNGIEPGYSYEMPFDHGTMVPLNFLMPKMDVPVVPVMFNTLADPQPTARRCLEFGRVLGQLARESKKRVGFMATGGLSHDPGEKNHGLIDTVFDNRFLAQMVAGDTEQLGQYTRAQLGAAGGGAFELLAWIALAGAVEGSKAEVLAYEAVKPWATGVGVVKYAA